jgi:glyoxylase-like metal-dependent hydrolase (beta-lactamase superfamily II)
VEIEFVGGARTVTGSKHVVRTDKATVLLDCGLFQGRRQESNERNRHLGIDSNELSAVVLSHAHIDHSGALPLLVKQGYGGAIHSTAATRDLCAAMLVDAALIQAADARYVNKRIQRDGADMTLVEPLYTEADALRTLQEFERRTEGPGRPPGAAPTPAISERAVPGTAREAPLLRQEAARSQSPPGRAKAPRARQVRAQPDSASARGRNESPE